MSESLWTFFFEIANFLLLAAGLGWLFFKPVRAAMDRERARRRQIESEAEKKLADAQKFLDDAQAERKNLTSELEGKRAEALETVQAEVQRLLQEARAKGDEERKQARQDAFHIAGSAQATIGKAIASAARQSVEQLLKQVDGPELEMALVSAVCRQMESMLAEEPSRLVVESAQPLSPDARGAVAQVSGTLSPEFEVNSELRGGLRVSTDKGLIDASLRGLAEFAERSFAQELERMVGESQKNG